MIVIGLILLLVGFIVPVPVLVPIGAVILVVGLILALMGGLGRPVGGRQWYY